MSATRSEAGLVVQVSGPTSTPGKTIQVSWSWQEYDASNSVQTFSDESSFTVTSTSFEVAHPFPSDKRVEGQVSLFMDGDGADASFSLFVGLPTIGEPTWGNPDGTTNYSTLWGTANNVSSFGATNQPRVALDVPSLSIFRDDFFYWAPSEQWTTSHTSYAIPVIISTNGNGQQIWSITNGLPGPRITENYGNANQTSAAIITALYWPGFDAPFLSVTEAKVVRSTAQSISWTAQALRTGGQITYPNTGATNYQLQSSTDLQSWQVVSNLATASDPVVFTLPPAGGPRMFYRIAAQ